MPGNRPLETPWFSDSSKVRGRKFVILGVIQGLESAGARESHFAALALGRGQNNEYRCDWGIEVSMPTVSRPTMGESREGGGGAL